MVTANPDVTCHEIMEDDEFLVLACDGDHGSHYTHPFTISDCFYMITGIWDCLCSQEVVDFVRYQVSEGKELTEIGEMICDYCLAPDSDSGGIGCDNMTFLIVAITHGRSKEEWYTWIADRVRNNYGYETPKTFQPLYSESRLRAFRVAKENHERLLKEKKLQEEKEAAERNASTSAQSTPSPTQARSENNSSAGSARKDKLPESKFNSISNTISNAVRWGLKHR
jgi:protein phosphatase 2C family protein 2/3